MSGENENNDVVNENDKNEQEENQEPKGNEIPESFKNDLFKHKRMTREQAEQIEKLQSELKERDEKLLKNQNNYKGLYEQTKNELEELRGKHNNLNSSIVQNQKISAVEKAAIKAGIDPDAMKLLSTFDLSDVEIETTSTGRFNVIGADEFVNRLKDQNKFMFKNMQASNVNNSSGSYKKEGDLSAQELIKLKKENYDEYLKHRQKGMQQRR